MSVTLAAGTATQPPVHHASCAGGCGIWPVTGTAACMPYPCKCADTRKSRPKWAQDSCWWIKKTTERATSKCPCWGRVRDEALSGNCCSWHPENPRYAPPPAPITLDDLDVAEYVWDRPERRDAAEYDWSDPEEEFAPYELLWTAEERTCGCKTPFDGARPPRGWHCSGEGCHQDFASYAVGEVHRRRWTEPCRPPDTVRDIDTGFALLRQGADGVWSAAYPTAD